MEGRFLDSVDGGIGGGGERGSVVDKVELELGLSWMLLIGWGLFGCGITWIFSLSTHES